MGLFDKEYNELCSKLDAQTAAIEHVGKLIQSDQEHSRRQREWQPFVLTDAGTTDANGAATVGGDGSYLVPAPNGWEARVHRIVVTVHGASAAATVTTYHGAASDTSLFDFAQAMLGNTPSRQIADYNSPVYFAAGESISVVIGGAVATQAVVVRVEGLRRML